MSQKSIVIMLLPSRKEAKVEHAIYNRSVFLRTEIEKRSKIYRQTSKDAGGGVQTPPPIEVTCSATVWRIYVHLANHTPFYPAYHSEGGSGPRSEQVANATDVLLLCLQLDDQETLKHATYGFQRTNIAAGLSKSPPDVPVFRVMLERLLAARTDVAVAEEMLNPFYDSFLHGIQEDRARSFFRETDILSQAASHARENQAEFRLANERLTMDLEAAKRALESPKSAKEIFTLVAAITQLHEISQSQREEIVKLRGELDTLNRECLEEVEVYHEQVDELEGVIEEFVDKFQDTAMIKTTKSADRRIAFEKAKVKLNNKKFKKRAVIDNGRGARAGG
jgi:hypothetical protein